MSWRTVIISNRCKLDLNMGYMIVRGENTKRIFIDEIGILMLENPQISMTGALLSALSNNKTRIIFCDAKRSPYGELEPYYGCHDSSRKIRSKLTGLISRRDLFGQRSSVKKYGTNLYFYENRALRKKRDCLKNI